MFKCSKCDFQSENPGNCPTDNEVLVEAVEAEQKPDATPQTTDESISSEESKPTEK